MLNTNKRFYWIKLKTNFFNRDEIDFLLSQKNGCEYIVLYLMLCNSAANTNGQLVTHIGEVLMPYDINKIVRDTKHFDFDTVTIALELFKKLKLIYEEDNRILRISNFDEMVGSETNSAKRVREWRQKKQLQCNKDETVDVTTDVIQDTRDKIKEKKDKILNINTHTYECHLLKNEKDSFCLDCQKKNVCDKKTSEGFIKVFGSSFEDYIKNKDKKIENNINIDDYNWLEEEE